MTHDAIRQQIRLRPLSPCPESNGIILLVLSALQGRVERVERQAKRNKIERAVAVP